MKKKQYIDLGEKIYNGALSHRSGFDLDIDEDIWEEIYEQIGRIAVEEYKETEDFYVTIENMVGFQDKSSRVDADGMIILKQEILDWITAHQPDTNAIRIHGVFKSRGYHPVDINLAVQRLLDSDLVLGPEMQPVTNEFMYGKEKWFKKR